MTDIACNIISRNTLPSLLQLRVTVMQQRAAVAAA